MAGTAALGLSRELRTQPVRNRSRTSRRGQLEHKPVAMSPASSRPPRQAHYKRATSCRNKFLIRDRDTKFTAASDEALHAAHIRTLKSPVQAPPGETFGFTLHPFGPVRGFLMFVQVAGRRAVAGRGGGSAGSVRVGGRAPR